VMSIVDFDYIDAVMQADSVEALHKVCSDMCEAYQFDRFI